MKTSKSVEGPESSVEGEMVGAKVQNPKSKLHRKSKRPIIKESRKAAASRRALVEVLEQFGISVAGFDRLRSDSYEKQIAGRSLAELEQFYELLLGAGRGYKELAPLCPKWGKDANPPHWTTLQSIKGRITLEESVREHLTAKGLVEARKADGQHDEAEVFFKEGVEILAEELLAAKAKGKPISENLKVMDRLLRAAMLGVREQREERENAKLEWIQAGCPIVRPEPVVPVVPQEEPEAIIERFYGKKPEPVAEANHKDTEAESTKFQNPESKLQGNSNTQAPMTEPMVKGTGNKTDNHEIPEIRETKEAGKKAGLPEWATKVGSIMIGAPSATHPKGIKKCVITNLPVDVVTDEPVLDVDWKTLIGFGGDGSNN